MMKIEMDSKVRYPPLPPGEEIVISGIAGRFPESDNIQKYQDNLLNKINFITNDDRRWSLNHPEIPAYLGKVNNLAKFDASFFNIDFKLAHVMDPSMRGMLEHAYEAIVDAGINPRKLRGTNTAVLVGACYCESQIAWLYEKPEVNLPGILATHKTMLPNRVSHYFDLRGPSHSIDTACSSSLCALEHAYRSIRDGSCDAALVGGVNLCIQPWTSLQFSRLGVLCPDGRCKSFDESADGYVRSETLSFVFVQKAKDAKRVYGVISHAKTNSDGYKEQGITFPSDIAQAKLLRECYEECGIPPTILDFMEAHGTGTKVGDPEELNAIDKVFCTGRKTPLKIGSVKSNLGHAEPASGMCALGKVIVAMQTGIIPPNANFNVPRKDVEALQKGRIQVISEPTPWDGGYVGISSFGFGGSNAHIIMKSPSKEKVDNGDPSDDLPRLVVISGRTKEAVETIFNDLESRPLDAEYVGLFHEIFEEDVSLHWYRGYIILEKNPLKPPVREIHHYTRNKSPICFVFSGMRSSWPGMGASLMKFPVFARTIQQCHNILKPYGLDLIRIINREDETVLENIVNSFVGTTAVQIATVDLLASIQITPDFVIGHSLGELGCAYADKCLSLEETILTAYYQGLSLLEIKSKLIVGSMADIDLGYEDLKTICPHDIDIAHHNGENSTTISGPLKSVRAFITDLQMKNIPAREVPCHGIPHNSRYVTNAASRLSKHLEKIIKEPKERSSKWYSTSISRSHWTKKVSKFCSAEYFINNLLNPVLFEESLELLDRNTIVVEISPSSILENIILKKSITWIPLSSGDRKDGVEFLLQALGKLYGIGIEMQVKNLYPMVNFPVSRGTPMISPLIKWEHSKDWHTVSWKFAQKSDKVNHRSFEVVLNDDDYYYMNGHVIDGRNLLPATGYLVWVWEMMIAKRRDFFTDIPIVLEDIRFLRATNIPKKGKVKLMTSLHRVTGRFEITEGDTVVVTGTIRIPDDVSKEKMCNETSFEDDEEEEEVMTTKDIYKELRLRGYQYSGHYRGLRSATPSGSKGHILWNNDWVAFMDSMLQLMIIGIDSRSLFVPTGIRKLVVDPFAHWEVFRNIKSQEKVYPVQVSKKLNVIKCGGVEIQGARANAITRKKPAGDPVLEEHKFVSHRDQGKISLQHFIRLSTHLALENHRIIKIKTVELLEENTEISENELLSPLMVEALGDLPLIQANVIIATNPDRFEEGKLPQNVQVMEWKKLPTDSDTLITMGYNLLLKTKCESLRRLLPILRDGGFLLTREMNSEIIDHHYLETLQLAVILEKRFGNDRILLLMKKKSKIPKTNVVVRVDNKDYSWLGQIKSIMNMDKADNPEGIKLIIVGEKNFENGVLGFVNCLAREPGGEIVRCVCIQDPNAPEFSLDDQFYRQQLQLDLFLNVLRPNGVWGSYRHLPLPPMEKMPVFHAWTNQMVRGDLSSFRWMEGPMQPNRQYKDVVHIVYAPINFRDVMLSTGRLAIEVVAPTRKYQECVIGFEYCGFGEDGRRLVGLSNYRCLANIHMMDRQLCWEVPDDWNLEDAATVPCVYATCYYALYVKGNMKKGDKILIHAGSGGVGQAAINLALYEGCEVFTTVGTHDKRRFIRETFPSIDDNHIGNSRDTSFEKLILKETKGRGVDIVLNSLSEEKLQASVRCLTQGGRFLEIGKFDLAANNNLGMGQFAKGISFTGVMLDNLFIASAERKKYLHGLVDEGFHNGAIKALTRTVFPKDELEAAFRYMAAGKHMGKVLIKIQNEEDIMSHKLVEAFPRYYAMEEKSYLVIGGLGGFGLELVDWLVLRGAKNIVITSRQGIKNGYQQMRINLWKSYRVKVMIISGKDAANSQDCQYILESAEKLGPLDGIFNLAVALKDGLLTNQTDESFEEPFKAKAWATKTLDELSRKLCKQLRHFVIFSSVSCGRGNVGQTNYGMANSIMERICEKRSEDGFPALAIQWGAIGDVGLVADMQENDKELIIGGTLQQKISSCLEELEGFLLQDRTIVSSILVAEKRAGSGGAATPIDAVMNIMGVKDLKNVSSLAKLSELGMDSMTAVEIKQTLEREFEIFLTAQDLRNLTFEKLLELSQSNKENSDETVVDGSAQKLTGLGLFIRLLGTKNIISNVCMDLPTAGDPNKCEVFIVPGIEGFGSTFSPLGPRLKPRATCLQMGMNIMEENSIESMADYLFPHLKSRIVDRKNFKVLGYSFGTLIAIELVRKLENQGFSGELILLDGTPSAMASFVKDQFSNSKSNEELEDNFLLKMIDVINPTLRTELATDLEECKNWDEKLNKFLLKKPAQSAFISTENGRAFCTAIFTRVLAVKKYTSNTNLTPIKASITYLHPTIPSSTCAEEDYGVRKVTRGEVKIYAIPGNHVTMLEHDIVTAAINGELLEDMNLSEIKTKADTQIEIPPINGDSESSKANEMKNTELIKTFVPDEPARS